MILSDGGTENPKKILEVYTNSSRGMTANSRIFTYAVGPHPLPTVALKVELVSKELNHLAAILHVYAGGLIFMK